MVFSAYVSSALQWIGMVLMGIAKPFRLARFWHATTPNQQTFSVKYS